MHPKVFPPICTKCSLSIPKVTLRASTFFFVNRVCFITAVLAAKVQLCGSVFKTLPTVKTLNCV